MLAVCERHPLGPMLGLYNVTDGWRPFPSEHFTAAGMTAPVNALGGHMVTWGADGQVWLGPYAAWWVVDRPAGDT